MAANVFHSTCAFGDRDVSIFYFIYLYLSIKNTVYLVYVFYKKLVPILFI